MTRGSAEHDFSTLLMGISSVCLSFAARRGEGTLRVSSEAHEDQAKPLSSVLTG